MATNGKKKLIDASELTPVQEKFLLQVVMIGNVAAAARECGIAIATAHRWFDLPLFQEKYHKMREAAFITSQIFLEESTLSAAHFVLNVMNSEHVSIQVRLKAAALLLDHGREAHNQVILENRIAEIEHRLHMNDIAVTEVKHEKD